MHPEVTIREVAQWGAFQAWLQHRKKQLQDQSFQVSRLRTQEDTRILKELAIAAGAIELIDTIISGKFLDEMKETHIYG